MNKMKIHRKNQNSFDFFENIPKKKKIPTTKTPEYLNLKERTTIVLQKLLNNCNNYKDIVNVLKSYKFKWNEIDNKIAVIINNETYTIDNFDEPVLKKN